MERGAIGLETKKTRILNEVKRKNKLMGISKTSFYFLVSLPLSDCHPAVVEGNTAKAGFIILAV